MNLVLTNHFERPFKPSLGVNLRGMLFELNNNPNRMVLENQIKDLLEKFEPRITVTNVMSTPQHNLLIITLMFQVGNSPEPHSLDLVLERIR